MLRIALFDLDDTLYPPASGLWDAIRARIELYMIERVGLPREQVPALRVRYYLAYGTALNGLRREYGIEPADYLAFVHDIPLDQYLRPEPALDAMLARLAVQKVVLTNADEAHARRVLARLGIERHFTRVIDVLALEFVNKPEREAYERALRLLDAHPQECLFADDLERNLAPAHSLGMPTVLVNPKEAPGLRVTYDYWIRSILELESIVAEL
jgi:putative hydrolase of the HAD superfamily